jgi:hypothetical protein
MNKLPEFINLGDELVLTSAVATISFTDIEQGYVYVTTKVNTKIYVVDGFAALELVWLFKPSALEGNNKIKWHKHVWAVHNLIAHPLMQILAWFKLYKQAIWIHDVTVPKPIGYK